MRDNKKFSIIERIIKKITDTFNKLTAQYHANKLNDKNFTIISNNCWGGIVYEYFNLPKQSPTVGSYFFAEDYVKFVKKLYYYLSIDLKFIDYKQSKHSEELEKRHQTKCPIGQLDDVEIVFLHYKTQEEALSKWERRIKRINPNNIILKFSFINECNDNLVKDFLSINGYKKLFFSAKEIKSDDNCVVVVPGDKETGIVYNDTFYFKKYINLIRFLNSK